MARADHHPDRRSGLSVLAEPSRLTACSRGAGLGGPPIPAFAVLLALLAGCAIPPLAIVPRAPVVLGVVTWNMHAGRGDLPRLIDDLQAGRAAGVPIRDYVLLLQEAIEGGDRDVTAFARTRNLAAFFSAVRPTSRGATGNAIVSNHALAMPRVIDLPRERQPRAAVATAIEIDGTRLVVVDAHFENRVSWRRGGLFSDRARGRQADALLGAIPDGDRVILGGDFNTWLGARETAWRKLAARFPDTPGPPFAPTFRGRLVLDHLFFDLPDGWRVARLVAAQTYGSDHRPVIGIVSKSQTARSTR